jgi:L-threonylcarbamoyladenylate synthase
VSATLAEHVLKHLGGRIDLLLDGGPTPGGLESTVLDVSAAPPRLLRPGLVAPAEIEAVIGPIERPVAADGNEPLRSPGLLIRHYSPQAALEALEGDALGRVETLCRQGKRVGWLTFATPPALPNLRAVVMLLDPTAYAARLYAALHELDDAGVEHIVVTLPPTTEEWQAIRDRLHRAAR